MPNQTDYQQEWISLHKSYDHYEAHAFVIKIVSIILFFSSFFLAIPPLIALLSLLVLWLQEGIWKTFQSRTEQRLLTLEAQLTQTENKPSFQFYTEWEKKRSNNLDLMKEYAKQALRPTVAYPYVVLVGVIMFQLIP